MKEVAAIKLAHRKDTEAQQKKAQDQLSEARTQTESSIRFAVVNAVFSGYPSVLAPLSGAQLTNKCTYSTLDRSQCFTSVPLTVDDESRFNGESLY
jgi:hypothetical protein